MASPLFSDVAGSPDDAAASASGGSTADRSRTRILDAAAAMFIDRGYERTSLRRLADEVGMKAGSLYYHFASKDELLTAILECGIEVMHDAFDDAERRHADGDPFDRLAAHVRAHLSALFEHGPYTAAHVVTFRTAPESVRARVVPTRDAYEARWTDLLAELQQDGALDPAVGVNVARLALMGAMNSAVEWFDPERGSIDDFAVAIATYYWKGVSA